MASEQVTGSIRRAEIVGALSLATDLALGQTMENALRSCVLAMRIGEAAGLASAEMETIYWTALLRHVGCNAESHSMAALFGDEVALSREVMLIDSGSARQMLPLVVRMLLRANSGEKPLGLMAALAGGLAGAKPTAAAAVAGHCEVAEGLARRLGFGADIVAAVGQSEERWDGRGFPVGLKGEALPKAVRVVNLARDFVVLLAGFGPDGASAKIRERSGRSYDPVLTDLFLRRVDLLTAGFEAIVSWTEVLRLEPEPRIVLDDAGFDSACLAIADFADIKSPFTGGHSRAVAALAIAAARHCRLGSVETAELRRAAMLHDIGQSAISTRIWAKPGLLTEREWEEVRLHPYYGERVLSRSPALARIGALVAAHHERLDATGYHRGLGASGQSPQARILAVAEAYRGMVEARPHRAAFKPDHAASELRREAKAGRWDGEVVEAVLAAAGHAAAAGRKGSVAGLTERELDVLRLLARGKSMKEIGRSLGISPKTVDNHLQHIYPKIEARTRAGATLFAIERGILAEPEAT